MEEPSGNRERDAPDHGAASLCKNINKNTTLSTCDKAVIITGLVLFLFVCSVLWLIYKDKSVPDSLIFAVLGGGSFELGLCERIFEKKSKRRESNGDSHLSQGG